MQNALCHIRNKSLKVITTNISHFNVVAGHKAILKQQRQLRDDAYMQNYEHRDIIIEEINKEKSQEHELKREKVFIKRLS